MPFLCLERSNRKLIHEENLRRKKKIIRVRQIIDGPWEERTHAHTSTPKEGITCDYRQEVSSKKVQGKDKESNNNNKKNKDKEVRQDSSPSNDNYHMVKCTGNILSPAHSCELSKPHIELCTPFKRQIKKLVFQIQRKA